MYLPMIPLQVLFFIGCSSDSLGFLGEYGLYNLMF
jgi:prepilin signal peptidase PulO-like enzyme (type II secretory pathway)